jgi:hypothetical protein
VDTRAGLDAVEKRKVFSLPERVSVGLFNSLSSFQVINCVLSTRGFNRGINLIGTVRMGGTIYVHEVTYVYIRFLAELKSGIPVFAWPKILRFLPTPLLVRSLNFNV